MLPFYATPHSFLILSIVLAANPNPAIGVTLFSQILSLALGVGSFLYLGFWLAMMVHCLRNEPDRIFWLWLMIILQGLGPFLYFVLRFLPSYSGEPPTFFKKWKRAKDLARLETAAVQIGNPHQFVQWGEALKDVGHIDQAAQAFGKAIQREPENLQALWGACQIASIQKRHSDVRNYAKTILDKDPQYKFGDVSLAYGKSLIELQHVDEAVTHLEQHVRRWRHPEAVVLVAKLLADRGDIVNAQDYLQSVIHDISGSPSAIARKHNRWKSQAKQLLKKIGTSSSGTSRKL